MDNKEFKELLMLHGADIGAWPEEFSAKALKLLEVGGAQADELKALVEEEADFEALLVERAFIEPNDYLAERIIAHACDSEREDKVGLLGSLFAGFFTPRAVAALVLTLIIGFMVGYMSPGNSINSYDPFALDDEALFEETFSSLFMEGDIFE